jgi:hypothetical protein
MPCGNVNFMKPFLNLRPFRVIVFLTLFFIVKYDYAQTVGANAKKDSLDDGFDIRHSSFLLPQALPEWKYYQNASILYVVVPKDWATTAISAPMLNYAGKYTLPYGFNLQASLATLFISYRINLGPFWNYSVDHFHFGAGYQFVFNYGFLNQFGFNTKITIWEQQPAILVGYSFKKTAVTLRGDLYLTNSISENQGGHTVTFGSAFTNGYSITAALEQRLWKNRLMSFAVKLNYLKYHIIAWPAFPVNQYRYWVPEFHLGLSF